MIDRATAVSALADPRTPAGLLANIAQSYPDLWPTVAQHPQAYSALLDWLAGRGDSNLAAIVQAVRARQAAVASGAPSPLPAVVSLPGYAPMTAVGPLAGAVPMTDSSKSSVKKAFDSLTGFEGETIVQFHELFRDTFKKHSRADMDLLMYSGTEASRFDRQWRLPWLYARVFTVVFGAFLLLWVCMFIFEDTSGNVVPGVIFTAALAMPATVMVFFWEFNQARNVSLFDVLRYFFIGGAMSILLTFLVSAVTDLFQAGGDFGIVTAFIEAGFIGFTEELAKAIVVLILLRNLYGCLISNGLLVGAVVGTGFAVFETMGYGTSAWITDLTDSSGTMEHILLIRGILSLGGHVVWAAISGAAIMLAQRPGSTKVSLATTDWGKFFALFCVPFILHAAWDFFAFVVYNEFMVYALLAGLTVLAWVFIVRLINSGLRQYASLMKPTA